MLLLRWPSAMLQQQEVTVKDDQNAAPVSTGAGAPEPANAPIKKIIARQF